jgi:hypothetical protein
MTFRTVREIGLRLPGAEESTMYGAPALKVGGKWFACIASHSSAEANTLAVRVDFAQRDALVAEDPAIYYLKDHYVGYPVVLVRLARVHADAMRDLLTGAYRAVQAAGRSSRRRASPSSAAGPGARRPPRRKTPPARK